VAIFIWYADRTTNKFQDFLREERKSREEAYQRLIDKLDVQTRQIIVLQGIMVDHDTLLKDIMPRLKEVLYTKE
jgi:hypothetical protein